LSNPIRFDSKEIDSNAKMVKFFVAEVVGRRGAAFKELCVPQ
jgi:hypothetical protein